MEFQIEVQGYYKDQSRKGFPHTSGIYFVYRGIYVPYLESTEIIIEIVSESLSSNLKLQKTISWMLIWKINFLDMLFCVLPQNA